MAKEGYCYRFWLGKIKYKRVNGLEDLIQFFIFIPRKNGKTLLASATIIADSIIRFEMGGEVVMFATKRKQAKLAYTGVQKMVAAHKDLKEDSSESYGVITMNKTDTTFSTLGRDSSTEDGLNPTIGVSDEYHAHPDNSLYDVVESGQGSRIQPLMFTIYNCRCNFNESCLQHV